MDLVDFQSMPDGEFKWCMHYQDHFFKISILHPLMRKEAAEVAHTLVTQVFTVFGCPVILQSDNGREFVNG